MDYDKRLKELRAYMREKGANAFILKTGGNIRYLCCSHVPTFAMLTYLVVTPRKTIGITSSLEEFRSREQAVVDDVMVFAGYKGIPSDGKTADEILAKIAKRKKFQNVLMDSKSSIKGVKVKADDVVERMREVKDDYELRQIRSAVKIAHKAEEELSSIIKPGKTEIQAAADLNHVLRSLGGSVCSFETIVATGVNSAYSHHDVSRKKIGKGDAVIIDFGVFVNGYCSDITRTLLMKNASSKMKKVYKAVEVAQQTGIDKVAAGVPFCEVESAIRETLKPEYDRYFVHSTGHGFGLEVHERPWVRFATPRKEVIRDGNVFTVEPGVYIPGKGGVRIEDDILVKRGTKIL